MPVTTTGVQYSGIWTMNQVNAALAAGTWTGLPQLFSWGNNASGQLGLGNTTSYSSPKQIGALSTWSKIATRAGHSIVTKIDGTLWAFGVNSKG